MGDEPTADDAGARVVPDGSRRRRGAAEPLTVEQLLARPGGPTTGGRRAARRQGAQPSAPSAPPPGVRNGLPPVPAGSTTPPPTSQAGLPPVPGAAPRSGLPPVPGAPADWQPDARPSRRSGPIPPLPGTVPPPVRTGSTRLRPPRPARRELTPGRRRLVRAAVALAAVAGVVLLYHLGLYFYVDQKISRVEALATDGPEILAAQLQESSETYLVVGTGVPEQDGPASVATLLASVAEDGERAVLVGFPPSALVDTPECRSADGELRAPTTEAFARSLLDGGPSCMVRAVQQLSGVEVDHYLEVDLARLPGMVDALGGVPMCVVPSRATAAAAVPPPPGASELSGEAAAGYLRPAGEGTDATGTAVAERTQRLLTSTLRAAMSRDTLLDPPALARFLSRAADALTVDEQTTLGDLRALATSLGNVSGDAVARTGLPVAQVGHVPAGMDEAFVLLDGAGTRTLFDAVIDGQPRPGGLRRRRATPRRRRRGRRPPRRPPSPRTRGRPWCRRPRSRSTCSTGPAPGVWPPTWPTSCAARASSSATSATTRAPSASPWCGTARARWRRRAPSPPPSPVRCCRAATPSGTPCSWSSAPATRR